MDADMIAATTHAFEFKTPGWLARAYAYVGADSNPQRYANERDRAFQRMAMPAASVAWIFAFHHLVGTPVTRAAATWCGAAIAYALASALYRMYLAHHPTGGVHAQYAFLAGDPLIVGWALYAAPEPLAWWLVLLLVMIVRVGLRYGLTSTWDVGVRVPVQWRARLPVAR